jgi:hypothetical protein
MGPSLDMLARHKYPCPCMKTYIIWPLGSQFTERTRLSIYHRITGTISILTYIYVCTSNRGNSVGIATGYRLDGRGVGF